GAPGHPPRRRRRGRRPGVRGAGGGALMLLGDTPARALAAYAHPDDPEVACGGTLARWARAGCEVQILVACAGEKGTSDPDADPAALAAQRADEVRAAAVALGVADVVAWGHPDGELD